jgi:secreted trypsin-like serine protease
MYACTACAAPTAETPSQERFRIVALVNASASTEDLYAGHFCGGVLVAETRVLTATHCVEDRLPETVSVVDGVADLYAPDPSTYVRSDVIAYRSPSSADALVTELELRIALPMTDDVYQRALSDDATVTALGWGRLSRGGQAPCLLREVKLSPVADTMCAEQLTGPPEEVDVLCTVPADGDNTCDGDSGGPVYSFAEVRLTEVAVTVSGAGCGSDDPGLNVRVWSASP